MLLANGLVAAPAEMMKSEHETGKKTLFQSQAANPLGGRAGGWEEGRYTQRDAVCSIPLGRASSFLSSADENEIHAV